jgi:aminoglycoside phosphotransferase (APT) family kinase protein
MTHGDVDPNAVLDALAWRAAGPITPVTGGHDTAIWRFVTDDGAAHALRLFRAEQVWAARSEEEGMRLATAGRIPVPRLEASGLWQGRPVMVLAWAPGLPMNKVLERRPWTVWRLGVALGRMQARIHTIGASSQLQQGAPHSWLGRAGPEEAALLERLTAQSIRTDTLIHLDYHPLNVLADARRITAVIDWTNAAAGDPRADVARTITILHVGPLPPDPLMPVINVMRRLLYLGWRRGYEQVAGPLGDIAPFLAWAGVVLARDLEPRIGRADLGLRRQDVDLVWQWVARWKQRAGIV